MTDTRPPAPPDTIADAITRIVRDHIRPEILTVKGQDGGIPTEILILPDGQRGLKPVPVKDFLDPYRMEPERRRGTANLTDLDSLIALANRFKDADSALFAIDDRDAPVLQAVLNYNPTGAESKPRFGDHRIRYAFPLSDEWQAWKAIDGSMMEQADFAEFLENRIIDVMAPPPFLTDIANGPPDPETESDTRLQEMVEKIGGKVCGPARLMELAKGLRIHDAQTVKEIVNTNTGEIQLKFDSEHRDAEGRPIAVPNLFLIAIPVFRKGELYRIPVRLRYRLRAGRIGWALTMHRPDLVQDHAFDAACSRAATETGLPVFLGQPEA